MLAGDRLAREQGDGVGLGDEWQRIRIKNDLDDCSLVLIRYPFAMFSLLAFDLVSDYATPYDTARGVYLTAAQTLKEATGPYKAARDAYVAATATYTKSLYE